MLPGTANPFLDNSTSGLSLNDTDLQLSPSDLSGPNAPVTTPTVMNTSSDPGLASFLSGLGASAGTLLSAVTVQNGVVTLPINTQISASPNVIVFILIGTVVVYLLLRKR